MPANVPPELHDKFMRCIEQVTADGTSEESAYGICYASVVEGKAEAIAEAGRHGFAMKATEVRVLRSAIKAVGDWEADVLAVPFYAMDSDKQFFDDRTEIMPSVFTTPFVAYQHGISPGAETSQPTPVEIGKVVPGSLSKQADGWHIRVVFDRLSDLAKRTMDAIRQGVAAVSSGSISHLARLEVDGQLVPYAKDMPGRIAVWPLAEVSIWDNVGNNYGPANRAAYAVPVIKAIYRGANIAIPEILNNDSNSPEAIKAAKKKEIQTAAKGYLSTIKEI